MIINEKSSRVKAAFQDAMDASLADQYYITGKSGEKKRIALSRERTPHNDSSTGCAYHVALKSCLQGKPVKG